LAILSVAQNGSEATKYPASLDLRKVSLELVSSTLVKSVPSQGLGLPIPCDPDDTILARFAAIPPPGGMLSGGMSDPMTIGSDGTIIGRFGREKINEIPRPVPQSVFLRNNDVYILTRGEVPLGYQINIKKPKGEVVQQPATHSQYFIARFTKNGTYDGVLALDTPFRPVQLGVFESGDFLLAGKDATGKPQIGVADSRGQFLRLLELSGDIHARDESDQNQNSQDDTALPRFDPEGTSLEQAVMGSQIVADGPDLLLFRPVGSSVFSISAGGEVRRVRLKVSGKVDIFAVKPSRNIWFVEFTHHEGNNAELFDMYSFNPATGEPINQYFFPNDLGFGLACADEGGKEFTFVMSAEDGNGLRLMKLAPKVGIN
jgi:hypothetical protein